METRIPHLRKLIFPIGFALICVVLIVAAFRWFGGALPLEAQGYRLDVPLRESANLVAGSDVQIAGVPVGRVVTVARDGGRARVTVELESQYAPLRLGTQATPRLKTLLGEAYLELAPGPQDSVPIPEGGQLSREQVVDPVQLDQFLETFRPRTRDRFRQLFAGLADALDGRAGSLNASLGRLAPFSADLAELLESLEGQGSELQRLIARSGDVLAALAEPQGSLQAAVRAGNDVLDVTGSRDRELAATVRALGPFLAQLQTTSDTLTEASGDVNRAVDTLGSVAPLARPALAEIIAGAPEFRRLFAELPATIAAGNRGLPALKRMVPAARRGFREFYPTARELIPLVQLLATSPQVPAGPLGNAASSFNGTVVGPEGLVQHYGKGIPTIWNETASGWLKRLPSNVMNPYPEPGGLLDIARLGFIKAFDCRNTGNPMYLPPTGTGSPPCVLQGPWEFNGKSAFYHRLHRASP